MASLRSADAHHERCPEQLCLEKLRFGRPLESVFPLHVLLGLNSQEDIDKSRASGIDGIIAEIIAKPDPTRSDNTETRNAPGWSTLEWLKYADGLSECTLSAPLSAPLNAPLSASPLSPLSPLSDDRYLAGDAAEEAVRATGAGAGGKSHDEGGAAKAAAESQERLKKQAKEHGIDAGRDNVDLGVFVKMPICVAAGLHRGHVLALRLYTSRMAHAINMPLHDVCSPERPHPYPTLCVLLNDAVWKLRAAQIEHRNMLLKKAAVLMEAHKKAKAEGDDDTATLKLADAKEIENTAKQLEM